MGTKREGFRRRSNRGDSREIEVLEFRRCSRDLLPFIYASRGRNSSYSGFSLHLFADFWVKMVACAKSLFGQKKCPKLNNLCLDQGELRLGEGELRSGEPERMKVDKVSFA